jgi:RimJ/RimL family protein N-acetyltransferase
MAWTLTDSLDDYLAAAGGFLRSRPVQNTIQLSAAETLRARGASAFGQSAPLFGWWRSGTGEITAALLHTPPYPVLLTALPGRSAGPLAGALAGCRRNLGGVNAPEGAAAQFAAAWSRLTGASWQESRRSRLFRLGQLRPPAPQPRGAARVATTADRALLESWLTAFAQDVGDSPGRPADAVDDRLGYYGLTLWEAGGAAVSLAGLHRPAAGVTRVSPVYTPPELRRQGYAGAVTAAVSQAALDAGAGHVVLFTDLANPTSNALYQRLGYRPVEDRVVLRFGA